MRMTTIATKDFIRLVNESLQDYDGFSNGISEVIQVWYSKTIQNHKGLFIVKDKYGLLYNRYIEATYNGDSKELYLDFYIKEFKHTFRIDK